MGSNNMIYYEIYEEFDCLGLLLLIGVCGGVEIIKSMDFDVIWYILMFDVGGFRILLIFDFKL